MSGTIGMALARFRQPALDAPAFLPGLWLVNSASWGTNTNSYLDPNATDYVHPTWGDWDDRFGATIGFGAFNHKYQSSGATDTGSVTGLIDSSPLGYEFHIYAINATWRATRADVDMEFQRADGSVIAVMRLRRDGNYRHGMWHGLSWASLTKAPQTGSYPRTNGWLRVDPAGFQYDYDPNASHSGINLSFRRNVDMSEVAKIYIPYMRAYMDYTGGSGRSTQAYLRAIGLWGGA